MTWAGYAQDAAGDDAVRVAQAEAGARGVLLKALWELTMIPAIDLACRRRLRAADPQRWTAEQQAELERLAWKYRRHLPRHLAPRANPDDPIVQELKAKEATDG